MEIKYRHLVSRIDMEEPTGACLVALHGEEVVASLGLRLREPGAYVNSLYVEPGYQGQGIGRELLRRAAALSEAHGKTTLGLAVHETNQRAQKLYQSLGFRTHTEQDGYFCCIAFLPLPT